ncbi:hypothetical protein ECZU20_53300 [Escherichia coli]|nr:hypothetical protein ECZU20_53300 [Escherichia coli]
MIRKTPGYGATGRSDAGLSGWKSGDWPGAAEAWLRAAQSAPRTDWQQFARKGLNTATGAAGKGVTKSSLHYSGIQKAE